MDESNKCIVCGAEGIKECGHCAGCCTCNNETPAEGEVTPTAE